MISGTVSFGKGGVTRNGGDANGGTGFLEHRASAFDRIINNNTAKLNALMDAMNGVGGTTPPDNGDGASIEPVGDGGGEGSDSVEGTDQYIMAKWSQVNGQLNIAISLQGKDTQTTTDTTKELIRDIS